MLRDALAQAWQVTPHGCMACSQACRDASELNGTGTCIAERDIRRYGDASPDLMYCAEGLVDAFPDARLIQIVRDGKDVGVLTKGDINEANLLRLMAGKSERTAKATGAVGAMRGVSGKLAHDSAALTAAVQSTVVRLRHPEAASA